MSRTTGNFDDFGMDTISLAGSLENKLKAMREAGFSQVMLKANDIVGHDGGHQPVATGGPIRSGKGPPPRANGRIGRRPADRRRWDLADPTRGLSRTARSMRATGPAQAKTARRNRLSETRRRTESAAIDDIPSSSHPGDPP